METLRDRAKRTEIWEYKIKNSKFCKIFRLSASGNVSGNVKLRKSSLLKYLSPYLFIEFHAITKFEGLYGVFDLL